MGDVKAMIGPGDSWILGDLCNATCHILNISVSQPLWLARPVYGFAAPLIILVTLFTNSLIVVVLSHKNLRTPTNTILLSMAITELMTGLSSCPWFLYYYTFNGWKVDEEEGLSACWCKFHAYFAVHLPTIFHTAAIWLTVYLAIQRYMYVCVPSMVSKHCGPRRTKQLVMTLVIAAVLYECPVIASESSISVSFNNTRVCVRRYTELVEWVGLDAYKATILCSRALLVHILPCFLLIIFTGRLFQTINRADRKRSITHMATIRRLSHLGPVPMHSSSRLMHATTKMLLVVIAIFLLIEIPVALIFLMHFLVVVYRLLQMSDYTAINNLIIIRNFLIIFTYPLNFAIYFGMSSSFKLQFRQMFTKKILYIAAPNNNEPGRRPRFSVQLIDIHKIRRPSLAFRTRFSLHSNRLHMEEAGEVHEHGHADDYL